MGKAIMVQGTASNVGKSVITAALCRILKRKGYRVAPFKAQNMANNSFVTREGGEIGRAQAVQAEACGVEPTVQMNPILLKPDTDKRAQIICLGKPAEKISFIGDPDYQKRFQPVAEEALQSLLDEYDVVVMEGAGSPAEMNLKERDIVNMSMAKFAKAKVILVGDIDWGGIFAQLVGTYELLEKDEQDLVCGFLINKFRGDEEILKPGLEWIEKRTGKKVLGVLPFLSDIELAEEDSISGTEGLRANVSLDKVSGKARDHRHVKASSEELLIDVLWLPRISNFTDFEPLKNQKGVKLRYLHQPDRHTTPDLLILPGTKSTIADLKFLRESGLADHIRRCYKADVPILGICGGYQMLMEKILDPKCVESKDGEANGLGLLPGITEYAEEKTTQQIHTRHVESGIEVNAYEIHMGQTKQPSAEPFFESDGIWKKRENGSWIAGTYLHGLFENQEFLSCFLSGLRKRAGLPEESLKENHTDIYDQLADRVEEAIDLSFLEEYLEGVLV